MNEFKIRKIWAGVLSLFMMITMAQVTYVVADNHIDTDNDNLILNKTAVYNSTTDEVEYALEAYAKGEIVDIEKHLPTDIVLVLDQSGSMKWEFGNTTRIAALQDAVDNFVGNVEADAIANSLDHRVSIIGFAAATYSNHNYKNSEILTTNSGNPIKYQKEGDSQEFEQALKDSLMDVVLKDNLITSAINNIEADGGTYIELGIEMARRVLDKHPVEATRGRAVIVFTDGSPSRLADGMNDSFLEANIIKAKGTPIYTVAIFDQADPAVDHTSGLWADNDGTPNHVNRFLHYLSSNYGQIENITERHPLNNAGKYMVASDAEELNNIFVTIGGEIGGHGLDLDASTQLIDIVTKEFVAPTAVDVKVYTQDYLGGDEADKDNWGVLSDFDANVTVENNRVIVKGFSYKDNYVIDYNGDGGTGKKLVVTFKAKPIAGFLGGNEIDTNEYESGIYSENKMIKDFALPRVDIKKSPIINIKDVNMYLTNELKLEDLFLTSGKFTYTLDGVKYEVDGLRNKHVNLQFLIKDKDGNKLYTLKIDAGSSDLEIIPVAGAINLHLEANIEFAHHFMLSPIKSGTVDDLYTEYKSAVKVFTPKVSAKDDEIYLGETHDIEAATTWLAWCNLGNCTPVAMTLGYEEPTVEIFSDFISGTDPLGEIVYAPKVDSVFYTRIMLNGLDKTDLGEVVSEAIVSGHVVIVLESEVKDADIPPIKSSPVATGIENSIMPYIVIVGSLGVLLLASLKKKRK